MQRNNLSLEKILTPISRLLIAPIILLISFIAIIYADNQPITLWDKIRFTNLVGGQTYQIATGTGFFVNQNYIVTNQHVVNKCRNIAVRGAVEPSLVTLVASDEELDLAILYSQQAAPKSANLRANHNLTDGDTLFIVGYPLNYGIIGQYLVKQTQLVRTVANSLGTHYATLEFPITDINHNATAEHGNSGGPLLDKNTNVVGVIRAKKTYYDVVHPEIIYGEYGVAIGLEALEDFLKSHGVIYFPQNSYDAITNYQPEHLTKDFVVNIHCIK